MRKRGSECMHAFNCFSQIAMSNDAFLDLNDPQEGANVDNCGASRSQKGIVPFMQEGSDIEQDEASQYSTGKCLFEPSKSSVIAVELSEAQDRGTMPSGSSGVAGILYKWVNLGKGWRPRWFVLEDGVLSYYKVHGPHKITLNHENQRLQIIGEESQRLMKKQRNIQRPRRPFGEVHLQVSSIRKSKSDDKKFYIYTGTKILHLRAETREDRAAWLEALRAEKESFLQNSSIQTLPPHSRVVSTEKLRSRLLEEGLEENAIKDIEVLMNAEFSILEEHLRILEHQNAEILRRLRQLEAEKLELEATLVDESRNQACEGTMSSGNEQVETETDTDEEEDAFFDTKEFLSSESFGHSPGISRQTSAEFLVPFLRADDSVRDKNGNVLDVKLTGCHYSHVERRKLLPEPKEEEKGVSLWSMIKNNIGKDLTKICLPVYFNEPLSSLQKCMEDMEYSFLLDQAYELGRQGNGLMRILNVAAFAVSGYASTEGRTRKPFNPLLGETFEADYPDKGLHFISEKVSHHPVILACHCEGRGWKFWGDCNLKSKFWGRSIQLDPVGILRLKFADGEMFQWCKVTTSIYNLILGRLYCDHYGTMRIQGINELSCKLKFKEDSIMDRNPHQVQGFVHDKSGNKLATLFGKWDDSMYFVPGNLATKPKGYDPMSEAVLLWRCNDRPRSSTRYNFTSFAITLNEITPGLQEKLPPTDSRLRPDQRYLENGEYELANVEKLRLEHKQRQARKVQESGWQPRWFTKSGNGTFEYIGGYWEAREKGKWDNCVNIFGPDIMESSS